MNKFIFSLLFMAFGTFANAQVIANLDEVALLGDWTVSRINGTAQILGNNRPKTFSLYDGKNSYIWYEAGYADPFSGFWIGGTATGKYTLHLLFNSDYEGKFGVSLVNFVITNFIDDSMALKTYDGTCEIMLSKDKSGVNGIKADTFDDDTKIYNLNGVEVDNPTHGIYIKGGEKILYP